MKRHLLLWFSFLLLSAGAADQLRELAEKGDAAAQLKLGGEYFFGKNRTRNQTLGCLWFRRSAQAGSPGGAFNYAACLENGWGCSKDPVLALRYYQQAEERGVAAASYRRLKLLQRGVLPGMTPTPQQAQEILRSAAKKYPPAKLELASLLRNRKLAEEALQALPRDPAALLLVGRFCRDGVDGPKEPVRALKLLEQAANFGSAEAGVEAAALYEEGRGTAPDRKKAFQLIERAARQGDPESLARLADAMLEGEFIAHDPVRAAELFEAASAAGNLRGMTGRGRCLLYGIGVKADAAKAFQLFLQAARAGDREAAAKTAECFEKGSGVEKNSDAAKLWYDVASGLAPVPALPPSPRLR